MKSHSIAGDKKGMKETKETKPTEKAGKSFLTGKPAG